MYAKRISDWLQSLTRPTTVEVRLKDEIVDYVLLQAESDTEALADELLFAIKEDAEEAGKTRSYTLIAIDEQGQRFLCPLRVRHVVEKAAHEMVRELGKHNIELVKLLTQERKDAHSLLLGLIDSLGNQLKREQGANDKHRERAHESFKLWEELQSKQQERDLEKLRHEENSELKERFADILVPLLVAAAGKYTGGKLPLPPANIKELAVREVAKAMQESQLDVLQNILGERWPEFHAMLQNALNGQVDLAAFRAFARELPQEVQMAVIQNLNPGQQAAIQVVLQDDNPN